MPRPVELSYAEERLELRFISATNEVAQHPSMGVAAVGATAARHIVRGELSADQVLAFANRDVPEPVVAVTAATHALVGAPNVKREDLRKSVGFAHGLVGHGFITTAVQMDQGIHSVVLPKLEVATADEVHRFGLIAADKNRMGPIGDALGSVASALGDIANTYVQGPIDEYHQTILAISANRTNPNRMAELGEARDLLAQDLTEPTVNALAPFMGQTEAMVSAQNILRHDPGPMLLHQRLGVPLPS